jgi:hypothetical protein
VVKGCNLPSVKPALLCIFFLLCVIRDGAAQERRSKLEWFIEGGGSFLNLGKQPEEVSILGTSTSGFLASPDHFSSSGLFFTGLRYHLTGKDALEAAYSLSYGNHFAVQTTTVGMPVVPIRFERYTWSFNYVRYLSERGTSQPFVTAGLGAIQSITAVTGWDRRNLSANFGLGIDFRINERLAFRLEVRDYVGFLPAPLRGASHDLAPSAGLVFSPRTSSPSAARFPQVEVFLEGGASVLTRGGSGVAGQAGIITPNGLGSTDVLGSNLFSKSGRLLAGFRVLLTNNNALELSRSESPNRYEVEDRIPAISLVQPRMRVTEEVDDYTANYARYLPWGRNLRPFLTAGVGLAHFAGSNQDIDKFGWNVGVGGDIPLSKRLAVRFELRDYMSRQPAPGTGLVHNIAPTAGLAYRFN